MSNNRDNMVEDKLKNTQQPIPESLRPENMEQKLASMSVDEKYKRSMSQDISDEVAPAPVRKRSVILPIVIAAMLVITVGLVSFPAIMRQVEKNKSGVEDNNDPDSDVKLGKGKESYEMAYENFKSYKKSMEEIEYVDYETDVVYEDAVAESTEAAAEAETLAPTSGATYKREESDNDSSSLDFTDTNVRTEGVNEGDVVKTDGKYIYQYDTVTEHLFFYSVDDGKIKKEGSVNVLEDDYSFSEMYIYDKYLVLMGTSGGSATYSGFYMGNTKCKTYIAIYDISDKGEPELVDTIKQSGLYSSSRMVDGKLYTFSGVTFDYNKIKKKKYETYIPDIDDEILDPEDVYVYDDVYYPYYTVISAVDIKKAKVVDKMAVMAGNSTLYVSKNNIYFANHRYSWVDGYKNESGLIKISYDDGELTYDTTGSFPGYLNDDYSIDEYDGYVRLVTTYTDNEYRNANALYILDEDLEKVSVIKNLAQGETVKSARFMGETGYFVTFRNTDPLFAVDLSDPENPKLTDYLKIPGFSAYLHPYGDGKMLGIGYEADEDTGWIQCIKFTMFDTSDPYNIKEEATKVYETYQEASVLNDRNAFMFDSNDGTFGMGIYAYDYDYSWIEEDLYEEDDDIIEEDEEATELDATEQDAEELENEGYYYMVFDYDDEDGFEKLLSYKFDDLYTYSELYNSRGIVIGDYLYVVTTSDGIISFDTEDYEEVDRCD